MRFKDRLAKLEAEAAGSAGVIAIASPACPPGAAGQAAFDAWAAEQRRRHAGAPGLLVLIRKYFGSAAPAADLATAERTA